VPNVDYAHAKQGLDAVLQEKVFRYQPVRQPWYVTLWNYVSSHIHLTLNLHSAGSVSGIVLATLVVAIVATLVLWGVVRWRNRSVPLHVEVRSSAAATVWQEIHQAVADQRGDEALRLLLSVAIDYAEAEHWLSDSPGKTARRCLKELRRGAPQEFIQLFTQLVHAAELAVFAGMSVHEDTLRGLVTALQSWSAKVPA